MAIIQCFYKLFQSFISNFELIISQKDDELANLKAKIKSLSKKNSTLKKKIKSLHETLTESKPDDSISPKYGYFEVDKPPIVTKDNIPSLNYLELIEGKTIKPSKIFLNGNLPNPEQLCPRCESPAKFHAIHTKTQKLCKCCNYHFTLNLILSRKKPLFLNVLIVITLFLTELKDLILMYMFARTSLVLID